MNHGKIHLPLKSNYKHMKYLNFSLFLTLSLLFFTTNTQAQMLVAAQGEVRVTSVNEMLENGALMVDVREQKEVDALAYDVENIIHVPISELEARINEIPKDKDLIIACRSGNRSRRVTASLLESGYTSVLNMTGGMIAWQKRGYDVIVDGATTTEVKCSEAEGKPASACCSSKAKASSASCAEKSKAIEDGGM